CSGPGSRDRAPWRAAPIPHARAGARPPARLPGEADLTLSASCVSLPASPARARVAALQVLHLSEQVAEMLGVHTALAVPGIRLSGGPRKGGGAQVLIHACRPSRRQLRQRGGDAGAAHALIDLIGCEQLRGEAPQIIECTLHALMALRGAIAQA